MDNEIFSEMNNINLEIISLFRKLCKYNSEEFKEIRNKNALIREKIRELSLKTEVDIEPSETSNFLDAIMSLSNEILFGIVPGAGGYDALVVLTYGENSKKILLSFLEEYKKNSNKNIGFIEVNFTKEKGTIFEFNN